MNNTNKHALHYHNLGFSVFPLRPKSKEPMYNSWSRYQEHRPSESQINKWWNDSPGLNIGVVCGDVSHIVVIDIDNKEKLSEDIYFPVTASVTTGRGHHLYYRLKQNQKVTSKKYDWGEVRSNGNYVVAPCSIHPSGQEYMWSDGNLPQLEDLEFFPDDLMAKLDDKSGVKNDTKLYEAAFRNGVTEGSRNSSMASAIGKLLIDFDQSLWDTTVWEIVQQLNNKQCKPPLSADELERTFKSIKTKALTNQTGPEKPEFKITTGAEMMKVKVNSKPFLVDRMIARNAINAITADTGKGKSIFMLILMRHLASGEKLFDEFETNKTKILIIDQEMDKDVIAGRYQKIIKDAYQNVDCLVEHSLEIDEASHYQWLKDTIIEKEYGCIVLDTLTNIHKADENSATEMRLVNKRLLQLVKETGVTIIYLHHHRKLGRGEKSNQSTSRGSTEIGAKMASHLLLDSKKDSDSEGRSVLNFVVKQVKARRPESVQDFSFDVIYDPKHGTTEWKYLGEVKDAESAAARASNEILEALKDNGEMTRSELQQECSAGNNAISEALKILTKNNFIEVYTGQKGHHPTAKVYRLNDEGDF